MPQNLSCLSKMPKLRFSRIQIYEFKNLLKKRKHKTRLEVPLNRNEKKNDIQCILIKTIPETSISTYFKGRCQEEEKGFQPTLEKLLKDKCLLTAFRTFLQSEFSEENIEFWLACRDYSRSTCPAERSCKATEIYHTFLHPEAEKEVNIDYHTREKIKQAMLDPDDSCFDEAERHVFRLMEKDSCPRFWKSDMYLNLQHRDKASR